MKTSLVALALVGCTQASSHRADAGPRPAIVSIDASAAVVAPAPPPPPPPAGPLVIVHHGMIVLDDHPPKARGPARLEAGEVPVDDELAVHGSFAASRAVDPALVDDEDRAWLGRTVLLGSRQGRCQGVVTELRVLGQVVGLDDEFPSDDPDELGRDVLRRGHPVLAGVVDAPCARDAVWAVPASSLPPIAGSGPISVERTGDGCPDATTFKIFEGDRLLAAGRAAFEERDVIDVDHDGWPEVILADGWMHAVGPRHEYERVRVMKYAYDWYLCIE